MDIASSFESLRDGLLNLDPVRFCENNLYLDGAPLRINGNGYKPFSDIYRYIGVKALETRGSKPVVIVKGRQVGATTMASALELYFVASNIFGTAGRPPMRIMHCFPQLELVYAYTKTKLNPMISGAVISKKPQKGGKIKTVIEERLDKDASANDSLTYKQFENGNHIWIESTGVNADRIRGRTVDCMFFDECFPFNQHIETEYGKKAIGSIVRSFKKGETIFVKTYNELLDTFEYKKVTNAWEKSEKQLVKITCGNREIRCTSDHRFLTSDGWKPVSEMKPGDLIKTSSSTNLRVRSLNEDQYQVILGSFLGDGHLSFHKTNRYRLSEIHCIQQKEYCEWKASLFGAKCELIYSNGYSKKPAIKFATKTFGLKSLPKTKSSCPQWVLDDLDARGLAIWFMDDGSVDTNKLGARISTCSFDEESQKRIVSKLQSMGVECHYSFYKTHDKDNGYFYVMLNKNGYFTLCDLIRPYVHPNLSYKLYGDLSEIYAWNANFKSHGYTVVDKIATDKIEKVYDIEVEDNHNFIVTSGNSSKNLGGLIAHNCQDMRKEALGNATKVLSKAKYGLTNNGIQVYFGTPKQEGTAYWGMWKDSSQQYFYLGCESCNEYFPLYTPGSNEWESIWLDDDLPSDHPSHGFLVKCTHCDHVQDKRPAAERGKWISLNPKPNTKFVGFHLNQLYMPTFRKWDVIAQKPENHPVNTERAYQNEILGEFFQGNAGPITAEQLYERCADLKRKMTARITVGETRKVYAGFDWGQKVDIEVSNKKKGGEGGNPEGGGQSYSCAVILTADGPHILSVEFATKLKHNDPQTKRDIVEQMFRQYSVQLAVGDIGYANDLTYVLQQEHGDKFLGSQAIGGSVKNHIKFASDIFPKTVQFERDYYIAELYDMLKKGKIRLPYGDYEKIAWLCNHICSMEIKVTQDRSGSLKEHYVKGATPNDGFMALLNAYLAYKFDITNGFKIINPNQMASDPQERKPIPAILSHIPRLGRGRGGKSN